jgi:hypothetical protein
MLAPNWEFVETEDWRADIEAKWSEVGADDCECLPQVFAHIIIISVFQWDGYILMMHGSSHMRRRSVSGRPMVR